ncbi:MAG: primosomal protein N' [bacterium]|nr:primosomal protein N' [bacterium]
MHFYQVIPASQKYQSDKPLTYKSSEKIPKNTVVTVELKNEFTNALVVSTTTKPSFPAKDISFVSNLQVPQKNIQLLHWMQEYYPSPLSFALSLFLPKGSLGKFMPTKPTPNTAVVPELPLMTSEQKKSTDILCKIKTGVALIHGDTGTGKTRVYQHMATRSLNEGKSVLILTPEIGLTPQLQHSFTEQFRERVIVFHSKMTIKQRRGIWELLATSDEPWVVIGPRSALFLPLKLIGLIVLDESHDNSYKQEQAPNYHATRIAAKMANIHGCLTLYGTATPSIDMYNNFVRQKVPIVRMAQMADKRLRPPEIALLSRTDKDSFGRSRIFASLMCDAIENAKQKGLTSLIFLNRRGSAKLVICKDCGWHATCPNCDLPLTYHEDTHELRCHVCGHKDKIGTSCPQCGSTNLVFQTLGTKALVTELQRLFPTYSIARIDGDNKAEERLDIRYKDILEGKIDILVGTQVIAKGLDLPKLGFVGIPYADSSLYIPDYTADEQTFQLLTQVMGRVGRTNHHTVVVVQTYMPDQPTINQAVQKDWQGFYESQIKERRTFGYPPFRYMLQVYGLAKREKTIHDNILDLTKKVQTKWKDVEILGPSPRFHRKLGGYYQWQVIIKSKKRSDLVEVIDWLPSTWRHNIDPINLL